MTDAMTKLRGLLDRSSDAGLLRGIIDLAANV